jgi:hypothetical protein
MELLRTIVTRIDSEIARLQRVRNVLLGLGTNSKKPHRRMSAKARARISRAQKLRWKKWTQAHKKAASLRKRPAAKV